MKPKTSRKPNPIIRLKNWVNRDSVNLSNFIATLSLIVAFGLGVIGVILAVQMKGLSKEQTALQVVQLKLSQKQDTTSLDLQNFRKLLIKTDTLISAVDSQLKLNERVQSDANIYNDYAYFANEEKLYCAFEKMEHIARVFYESPLKDKSVFGPDSLKCRNDLCVKIKNILVDQMGNPCMIDSRKLLEKSRITANVLNTYQSDYEKLSMHPEIPINIDTSNFKPNQIMLVFHNGTWMLAAEIENAKIMNKDWADVNKLENIMKLTHLLSSNLTQA